jgi:VanZ family protein
LTDRSSRSGPAGSVSGARRAALFWGIFLVALSSWPRPPRVPVVSEIPHVDKGIHFLLYAVEAFLLYRAIRWPGRARFSLGRVLCIVGAIAVWAVADEAHQTWIPGRSMEGEDVAADVTGAFAGALIASAASALKDRRLSSRGAPATRDLPSP